MSNFTNISIRLATPEDAHLPTFDNTKLVALDTCKRWGIVTYQMHKRWAGVQRTQALDAGSTLHQVFAAVRLYQLYYYDLVDSPARGSIVTKQGQRLFGKMRWDQQLEELFHSSQSRESLLAFCLEVLQTANYEEDPADKKRSMSALEEVAINYINRWDMTKYPIWVRDINDPETDVGIEIRFDLVITFQREIDTSDNAQYYIDDMHEGRYYDEDLNKMMIKESYRFTGALDGLHFDPHITNNDLTQGALFVEDNKTTGRIIENWYEQYSMDTQVVGYIIAARVFTEQAVDQAQITLSSLPVPAKSTHGGQAVHRVFKESYQITRWFDWFYQLAQVEQQYKDQPKLAPTSPHSCMRYFRPCSLLPYCTASDEEQDTAIEEMEVVVWNVLEEAGD